MIYLDHHSTTPCAPSVIEAMLPWMAQSFGNPHSSHAMGIEAAGAIEQAIASIASNVGAPSDSIIVTSGATEANNLAIRGVCEHPRQKRRHLISVATEHPAVLDVLQDLKRDGFRVTRLPVDSGGQIDLDQLDQVIDDDTALVSVMWANNEIGTIAPIRQIADLCHERGTLLHSDATQALGRMPVDVLEADVDLVSFSAHKCYGPKGTGFLVAGNGKRRVRLKPQVVGGGQQRNLRSGTMDPAAIVGMAKAIEVVSNEREDMGEQILSLRARLWGGLRDSIQGLVINGSTLESRDRLAGNLNFVVPMIEGEAWMAATPQVAFSTGSACSNTKAEPSHVLTSIGLSESLARQSVRFGIGRNNTQVEIDQAIELLANSFQRLSSGR